MITVHHLGDSQSERVLWLLEELGLEYKLEFYHRDKQTRLAPPSLRAVHRLGSAPVIQDGATTMAESGAILEYIMGRYGGGRLAVPAEAPNFADYLYWFHYANGSLMPAFMMGFIVKSLGEDAKENPMAGFFEERFRNHIAFVEDRLGHADYFAGAEFTAADIMMHFPFGTMRNFIDLDLSGCPNIRAYLGRISARPAYQKAMKVAGHERDPALLA